MFPFLNFNQKHYMSQIKKKFIADDAIDGSKIKLMEGDAIRIQTSSGEVELLKRDSQGNLLSDGEEVSFKDDMESHVDSVKSNLLSNNEPGIDSFSEVVSFFQSADDVIDSRIDPIENFFDFQKNIVYENNIQVYADGQPPTEDASLRPGWYYQNLSSGQKINWYFFDGINHANIQKQNFSAYAVVTFDSLTSKPFFGLYTVPTGTNDTMPGFAHSKYTYSVYSSQPILGVKYLLYIGQDPSIHPELPRINLGISSSQGDQSPVERVHTVSLGTDSGASANNVKVMVEHLGVNSPSFKANAELRVRPASLTKLSALTTRVNTVENLSFEKQSFTLGASPTGVTLSSTPKAKSTSVFVNRTPLYEGVDYTIAGNQITFIGDFAYNSGNNLAAKEGDLLRVSYYK